MSVYQACKILMVFGLWCPCSTYLSDRPAIYCTGELVNDLFDFYEKNVLREIVLPEGGLFYEYDYCDKYRMDRKELLPVTNLSPSELEILELMNNTNSPAYLYPLFVQLSHMKDNHGKRHVEGICVLFQEVFSPPLIDPFGPPHDHEFGRFYDTFFGNCYKFPFLRHLELYSFVMGKEHFSLLYRPAMASRLEYLGLPQNCTDEFLKDIGDFKNLKFINASATKIKGQCLSCLAGLPHLRTLDLRRNTFDRMALSGLKDVNSLTTLLLSDTNIQDEDLEPIGRLKNLERITLHRTRVTDEGLACLANLKNLKYVSLYETQTTPSGREQLLNEIPGLVIDVTLPKTISEFLEERKFISAYMGDRYQQYRLAGHYRANDEDIVESLKWYIIVASTDHTISEPYPERLVRNWRRTSDTSIRSITYFLDDEQIAEARRRADALMFLRDTTECQYEVKSDHGLPVYQYGFETIWSYED
ncbi:MAG: hypothetical protein JW810_14510 [Sedimentisphaerales bacterium]|nr:hypothetical protein [Sedimentisphaerales bacterium]